MLTGKLYRELVVIIAHREWMPGNDASSLAQYTRDGRVNIDIHAVYAGKRSIAEVTIILRRVS